MVSIKWQLFSILLILPIFGITSENVSATENHQKYFRNNELNPADKFLCKKQTRSFETALGIPPNLLTAISLAESGKWERKTKALFAWPWTIKAEGKGYYMPSKQSAVSKVSLLKAKGIKNIDVGCMQINLFYHPNAFEDLDSAFNPERNVGYAANFLAALNQTTLSWPQAAANYHSTTVKKNQIYLNKVLALWQKVTKKSIRVSGFHHSPNPAYFDPISRAAHTALLQSRFRARLNAEKNTNKPDRKKQDLDAWRRGRFDKNLMRTTMALQKAKRARADKAYLNQGKKSFSEKRRGQLTQWRKNRNASAFKN